VSEKELLEDEELDEEETDDDEEGSEEESESEISDEFKRGYKLYNFRRPDKFSKEHLRALQDIHRSFVRQLALTLSGYLRMDIEMDIISTDQLTYDEFICSMPVHIQNGIFKLSPLSGEISLGMSSEVMAVILDRMLGGDGTPTTDFTKELTQIEEALAKKIVEKIIKTLESSWSSVLPVRAEFTALDNGYHNVPIATSNEIVALISFEIRLGTKHFGLVNICFPYPVLETVLPKLTPQFIYQHTNLVSNEIGRNEILSKLEGAEMDLSVTLGTTNILINDLIELKEDDIIRLDSVIEEPLAVEINGLKKFLAYPGVANNRVCIKIAERCAAKE
jgi:flagellar motor switch protein FliM